MFAAWTVSHSPPLSIANPPPKLLTWDGTSMLGKTARASRKGGLSPRSNPKQRQSSAHPRAVGRVAPRGHAGAVVLLLLDA